MSSLIRPILASLLCGMIVLGHAPAWLHVVNCEGHNHTQVSVASEETSSVSLCPHGCQHHPSPPEAAETTSSSNDSDGHHQHDSDTCAICQSLAGADGVTWELLVSLPSEFVSEPAVAVAEAFLPATLLLIPQPRGPPIIA